MGEYVVNRPDEAALRRVLARNPENAAGAIIRLAWCAGLGRDEIVRLSWGQINLLDGVIRLESREIPMAKGVNSAGTTVSIQVNDASITNASKGNVVKYTKNGDGYDLAVEMKGDGTTSVDATDATYIHVVAGSSTSDFASSASKIPSTSNYFASDVVFVFGNSTTNPSVYTAVKKVAENVDYTYITNSDGDVTAVFVNTANSNSATASADVLFVNGTSTGTSTDNGTTYYAYNAYVDGAAQASFSSKNDLDGANGFYLVSGKDSTTGYYTLNGTTSYSANTGDYATVVNQMFTAIVNSRYATIVDTRPGVSDANKVDSVDELVAGMTVSVMYRQAARGLAA